MTDQPASVLLRDDANGIATLTLNRPGKFNALSHELLDALQTELDRLVADTSVRVVVLAANGKAFCAGHDLKEMRATPGKDDQKALFSKCSKMMLSIARIPQPVIAKVQGIATAAGCQLVGACDLAIASENATFATSGINVGLFCSTPMVSVSRNLSRKKAFEMLVTGQFIDAASAAEQGLINKAVATNDLDSEVEAMAANIASKPSVSVAFGKKLFYKQLEEGMADAYDMAAETMACNMVTEDAQAGVDAFIAKQPMPEWKGK